LYWDSNAEAILDRAPDQPATPSRA
jgi:hypothetical protein